RFAACPVSLGTGSQDGAPGAILQGKADAASILVCGKSFCFRHFWLALGRANLLNRRQSGARRAPANRECGTGRQRPEVRKAAKEAVMKLDSSISAIITGGASGLGEATARTLAAQGVK